MKYILSIFVLIIALVYGVSFLAYLDNYTIGKSVAVTSGICILLSLVLIVLLLKGTLGKTGYILAIFHILSFVILGVVVAGPEIIEGSKEQRNYGRYLDNSVVGKYGDEQNSIEITRSKTTIHASGGVIKSLGYTEGLDLYPAGSKFFADSNTDPKYFFSFRVDGFLVIFKRTPTSNDKYIGDGILNEVGRYKKFNI